MGATKMRVSNPMAKAKLHNGRLECCGDHPRYRAIQKPRVPCVVCWTKWLVENHLSMNTVKLDIEAVQLLLKGFGVETEVETIELERVSADGP